jgi:hypothetical protein
VKGTKRKNRRVSTQRSIDSEVTDNGKCQSSSSAAPLKNKRKGITEKLRSQILRKYPPSKVQQLHDKFDTLIFVLSLSSKEITRSKLYVFHLGFFESTLIINALSVTQ